MSVRELDDGRVLVHDFAGCSVEEVLKAAGCTFDDLFPPKPPPVEGYRPERRPFLPADAYAALLLEATVVTLIAADLRKGTPVPDPDWKRLKLAMGRLNNLEVAYGSSR